jgi:molybdate transport system ATP-binding protein
LQFGAQTQNKGLNLSTIQAQFTLNWSRFQLHVDLNLPSQGVTCLFGPSGSGKTTVLRCMAGLTRTKQGKLVVNGEIWQDATHWLPTYKRPLGYVFQEASLFPHLSVLNNLKFGLTRTDKAQAINLESIISLLGIGHLLDRKPNYLSGGESSRVGIARALASNPRILLLDEPLAALDYQRKQEIMPYLERLRDELAIPMIYVSHAPDEVARLADYLVVLNAGKVVSSGALSSQLTNIEHPLTLGADISTVLEGNIAEIDTQWHLARVAFKGGDLWVRDNHLPLGCKVRVRVLANDVSIATQAPQHTSIQNCLAGQLDAIVEDEHPGLALVRIKVGQAEASSLLMARITQKSLSELGLTRGQTLWVQIKSVALQK